MKSLRGGAPNLAWTLNNPWAPPNEGFWKKGKFPRNQLFIIIFPIKKKGFKGIVNIDMKF